MKKNEKKRDLNAEAGVNYDDLDPFKIACLNVARMIVGQNMASHGYKLLDWTRGESVVVVEGKRHAIGATLEALGTKCQVPDKMRVLPCEGEQARMAQILIAAELERLGMSRDEMWENIGICNANTVFNDMASLGVPPFVFNLFVAVGEGSYLKDEKRREGIIRGTARVCKQVGAAWGGGETQRLGDGQVGAEHVVLGGAAWGIVDPAERLIRGDVKPGDEIVLLESTGLHANGYSTARGVAKKLPKGMLTELSDGTLYGPALLAPTVSYSPFIQALIDVGVHIRYVVPMTGHGVRKLMRLQLPYDYELVNIPEPQPVFHLIQEVEKATDREMYETYNMGIGCALIIGSKDVGHVLDLAKEPQSGVFACGGGGVTKNKKGKRRVIMPSRLKMKPFQGSELKIR